MDVAILGGGPGGYTAAIRAAQNGLKVTVFERESLGGVCLNWGCIPTKALLRNAEVVNLIRRGEHFGVSFRDFAFDYPKAVRRSREVVDRLKRGVEYLFKKHGVTLVQGEGQLVGPKQLLVQGHGTVEAENIIIATGSRPRLLPDIPIGKRVMTSREILEMTRLPKRLAILGGGAIGLEFASIFQAYGVAVTIIEQLPQILPREDGEAARQLASILSKQGITLRTGNKVDHIAVGEQEVSLTLDDEKTIVADALLLAIGVIPNSDGLGLEKLGITTERGFIRTDSRMQTNIPGVYAIGDVTGRLPLAHVAMTEGIIAADAIAGKETPTLHYDEIPRCTYCFPQLASIGLTEEQAKEAGHELLIGKFPFSANGLAPAIEETAGQVKLIVDKHNHNVLGAHLVGPEVTELIPQMALLMTSEALIEDVIQSIYPHPTLSEAVREAALDCFGMTLNR